MLSKSLFIGERLRLAPSQPDDAAAFARWSLDSEYLRLLDDDPARPLHPSTLADEKAGKYEFRLRTLDDDVLIGFVALFDFQWPHGTAKMAMGIGDPNYRGKGYGNEALRLLLAYSFRELNLYRIGLTVFEYNTAAIRAYERVGFVHEGTIRNAILRDGQRYNFLLYGILREEWQARYNTP